MIAVTEQISERAAIVALERQFVVTTIFICLPAIGWRLALRAARWNTMYQFELAS
jgi:hypothetical protein